MLFKTILEIVEKKLIEEEKIKNYKFREDVLFTSSSTAGACVTGASVNGNDVWKK